LRRVWIKSFCVATENSERKGEKMEGERAQSKQRTGKRFTPCLERSVTAAAGEEKKRGEVRKRRELREGEKSGG
jgi:hypothetical protein